MVGALLVFDVLRRLGRGARQIPRRHLHPDHTRAEPRRVEVVRLLARAAGGVPGGRGRAARPRPRMGGEAAR